jgi:uncharacterized Zn-finger protein
MRNYCLMSSKLQSSKMKKLEISCTMWYTYHHWHVYLEMVTVVNFMLRDLNF